MTSEPTLQLSMTLKFRHPITVYSLVPGGVSPLAMTSAVIHMLDRNVVSWIGREPRGEPDSPRDAAMRWWLKFLDTPTQSINPVLCAFEGNKRRIPTLDEFKEEYRRSCEKIGAYFRSARIFRHQEDDFLQIYQNVVDLHARHSAEMDFLCEIAPEIAERHKRHELVAIRNRIFDAAQRRCLGTSLVLIATLSCLYEGATEAAASPARGVIKPKPKYGPMAAHNALSDVRAVEMLAASALLRPGTLGLCTGDLRLARFWAALGITSANWNGNNACTISPRISSRLFPILTDVQCHELAEILVEHGFADAGSSWVTTRDKSI
ncbi:hypothetical protein [Xanthomonas albilineans]|uniref:hypothetical protein n=1 Tax=Xanthomonas albilineans TaxID=29447 RepID=UPI0005F3402C|nr:hypothetical protein [Xanthomonas albilineans]